MTTEFLLVFEDEMSEFEDLEKIHIIRGRFLHVLSIIERLMKEFCNMVQKDNTYGQMITPFERALKKGGYANFDGFEEFIKALEYINPERNKWAHGIVYYKRRFDEKPNNIIKLGYTENSARHPYFEEINEKFNIIITWLKRNNLWNIENLHIKER